MGLTAASPRGGLLKLTNTTISTSGDDVAGVYTGSGGTTTISGGSVTTSGTGAQGILATGAGALITTTNGTTIETGVPYDNSPGGADSAGVQAD